MKVLTYADLDTSRVERQYEKVKEAIERGDFRSADVKKLAGHPYYRAKLDDTNRLLLRFARHAEETVCLALEVIHQHAYDKSRFLRGAAVDEDKIVAPADVTSGAQPLRYLNPARTQFHLLDKVVSFDEAQQAVLAAPAPLVLIGTAGSGKTALTLEKMRAQPGRVAFVTLSAHLARGAQRTYAAFGFRNAAQQVSFLSLRDFLNMQGAPATPEVTFPAFSAWTARHRQTLGEMDPHLLFEEFRGVLGASPEGPLSLDTYLALGVRQSLFPPESREAVHAAFTRYQAWLSEEGLTDPNLLAHAQLPTIQPSLDFLVVDEVQDFTPAQLAALLAALKDRTQFLLSGDAHQIVHPNFFSWAALRSLMWQDHAGDAGTVTALRVNFRNAREVTRVANTILKIKHARFGSVDRESSVLVDSAADEDGQVEILEATPGVTRALDDATRTSVNYAVLVLRDEDKAAARAAFGTPLIFSVAEAKGLEYENVILFNMVSGARAAFADICEDVTADDLAVTELPFRRARDKGDKSLEALKFYVNGLFVGVTRAVKRALLVEADPHHPLLTLLAVQDAGQAVQVQADASSKEAWAAEAQRLAEQGKAEQAQAIRDRVLKLRPVPWKIQDRAWTEALEHRAVDGTLTKARDQQALLNAALWHAQVWAIEELASDSYRNPAARRAQADMNRARRTLMTQENAAFARKNIKQVLWDVDSHGVEYRTVWNATPLMHAALAHNVVLIEALLALGAAPEATDEYGQMAYMYALARLPDAGDAAGQDAFFAAWTRLAQTLSLVTPTQLDVRTSGKPVRLTADDEALPLLLLMLAALRSFVFDHYNSEQPPTGLSPEALLDRIPILADGRWALGTTLRNVGWQGGGPAQEPGTYAVAAGAVHLLLRQHAVGSDAPGALDLWVETAPREYLPNPHLLLQQTPPGGPSQWRSVADLMRLDETNVTDTYAALLGRVSVPAWPDLYGGLLAHGPVQIRGVIGTPLALDLLGILTHPDFGLSTEEELTAMFRDEPAGEVGRTLAALRQARLVIPDDQGGLSGLFTVGGMYTAPGALGQLPEPTIRALLTWQRSGNVQDLTPHAETLRAAGFGALVAPQEQFSVLPGDHRGPVTVRAWPPLSSNPLAVPNVDAGFTAIPDFDGYVDLSFEARGVIGVLLGFGTDDITWRALLERGPAEESALTMKIVQELVDARLVLLDERNRLSFLYAAFGFVHAAGSVTRLPEALLRLVLHWQRTGDVRPLVSREADFRAAGFAWVLPGPGGMTWPAAYQPGSFD